MWEERGKRPETSSRICLPRKAGGGRARRVGARRHFRDSRTYVYATAGKAARKRADGADGIPNKQSAGVAPQLSHLPCEAGEVAREGARVGARRDISVRRALVQADAATRRGRIMPPAACVRCPAG